MKANHRLFKRGEIYYIEDSKTRKQKSLHTTDRVEAERLLAALNETNNKGQLALALGQIYIAAMDSDMLVRKWSAVMEIMAQRGKPVTQERTRRAHFYEIINTKSVIDDLKAAQVPVHAFPTSYEELREFYNLNRTQRIELAGLVERELGIKKLTAALINRCKCELFPDLNVTFLV